MAVTINASTSAGLVQTADTSGVLQLQTAGTTAVTVDASQNVGIGYATPSTFGRFVVQDSGSGNGTITAISSTASNAIYIKNTGTEARFNYNDAYPMTFYINNTERMRIESGGSLLVGTTTAISGFNMVLQHGNSGAGAGLATVTTTTDAVNAISFRNPNGQIGRVQVNLTTTTYVTSSDYRLKENIVPMTGALNKVSKLKPVTYTWKTDGTSGQGFIAHELQEFYPEAVAGTKDEVDAEGNPVHQGVDTSFLVSTLTAAIQEQQTIINDLTARITALEGAA